MSDSAVPRKPLHPFVKFVAIMTVVIVALDIATGVLANAMTSSMAASGLGNTALGPMRINVLINVAVQILSQIAYLVGLAVVVELVDRILWRLTPEVERRVRPTARRRAAR